MANQVVIEFISRDRMSAVARRVKRSLDGVNKSMMVTQQTTDRAVRSVERMRRGFGALGATMRRVGKTRGGGGGMLGMLAGLVGVQQTASAIFSYDTAVLKVMTNATNAAMRKQMLPYVESKITQLGRQGFSAEEAGRAVFKQSSQRGLSLKSLEALDAAVELSVGGFVDLEQAVNAMNKSVAIWPEEVPARMAEKIMAAQQLGDTDVAELARVLPIIGDSARALGMTSTDALAMLAAGSRILKDANKAAIGIVGMKTQVSQLTGSRLRTAKAYGFVDARGQAVSTPELVKAIAMANMTLQGSRAVQSVFKGEEASRLTGVMDARFFRDFMAASRQADKGNTLAASAAAVRGTPEYRWNQMVQSFAEVMRELKVIVLPVLEHVATILQKAIMVFKSGDGFFDFIKNYGTIYKDVAGAVFGGIGTFVGLNDNSISDSAARRAKEIDLMQRREQFMTRFEAILNIKTDPGTTAAVSQSTVNGNQAAGVQVVEGN